MLVRTERELEMSDTIALRKALQGHSLCPKLFTIHLNPLAWTLRTTDGYTLSKTIDHKITQLLFIDDMKIVVPNKKRLPNFESGERGIERSQ